MLAVSTLFFLKRSLTGYSIILKGFFSDSFKQKLLLRVSQHYIFFYSKALDIRPRVWYHISKQTKHVIWSVFGGANTTIAIHALEFWTEKSFTHISLTGNNYNYRLVAVVWDFEFYILKCKNFLIGFFDELGNWAN